MDAALQPPAIYTAQRSVLSIAAVDAQLEAVTPKYVQPPIGSARNAETLKGQGLIQQLHACTRAQFVTDRARLFPRLQRRLPKVESEQNQNQREQGFEHPGSVRAARPQYNPRMQYLMRLGSCTVPAITPCHGLGHSIPRTEFATMRDQRSSTALKGAGS